MLPALPGVPGPRSRGGGRGAVGRDRQVALGAAGSLGGAGRGEPPPGAGAAAPTPAETERAAQRPFPGWCWSSLLFPPPLKVSQGRGARGASLIPVAAAAGRGRGAMLVRLCLLLLPWWFCQEKRGLAAHSFLCVSGRKKTVKAVGCVLELERFAKNTGRVFSLVFLFKLREQCVTVGYPSGFCHNPFYCCL